MNKPFKIAPIRKKKGYSFDIKLPIFRTTVGFYHGEEGLKQFNRLLKRRDVELIPLDTKGGRANGSCCWVYNSSDVASIVHELHHVAYEVSLSTSIKNEEFEAYIQHYLYERVMKRLGKKARTKWAKSTS